MVYSKETRIQTPEQTWLMLLLTSIKHVFHPPFSQGAERCAEAEWSSGRFAVTSSQFRGSRFLLRGLSLVSRAGAGLDVEVLQDIVVDLGRDPLLLQHLLDGLVCGAGSDRGALLRGSSGLLGFQKETKHKSAVVQKKKKPYRNEQKHLNNI